MKNAIRSEYARGGFELDDVGAERELVAKFAESKLFQDEAAINRLARMNRSMLQTVKDWISDMVVKLTGTEEEKFFRNAERMYEKALREVGDGANSNGGRVQYSMGDVDLQRNVIDYTDQTAQSVALRNAMQQQVSADKVVLVTAEEINAHQTGTDWSVAAKARKWLRDAVTAFMGDSVHFEINGGNLEAYLTSNARGHFSNFSPSPEKAAAINRFYELIENAVYAYSAEHDIHSRAGENVQVKVWDYFVCPVDFGDGPEPFLFSVRSVDSDKRAQIYSMVTKSGRGSLRRNGSQETPVGRLSTYEGLTASQQDDITSATKVNSGQGTKRGSLPRNGSQESLQSQFSTYEGVSASQENDSTSEAKVNSEPGTLGDEQLRGQPPASYADTLREMQHPGARQSMSYADDLAHVNELLQNAALSPRDQAYIQEDIADAQRSCDAAMKMIADPSVTSEERTRAVQRAIDALDYARQRIDDLGLPATQLGVSVAQDALADISKKLRPYLGGFGGLRKP